jgi:hypothetical protein
MNHDSLQRLAAIFAGLFTGALCFVAFVLIPTWGRLSPQTYLEGFQRMLPITDSYMPVIGLGALACGVAAVLRQRPAGRKAWALQLWPLGALVATIAISAAVNQSVNAKIAGLTGVSNVAELADYQHRWAVGHVARTATAVLAYVGLIAGIRRRPAAAREPAKGAQLEAISD